MDSMTVECGAKEGRARGCEQDGSEGRGGKAKVNEWMAIS